MAHITGTSFTKITDTGIGAFTSTFAGGLATAEVGGTRYAYVSTGYESEIQAYEVGTDGTLTLRATIADTAATALLGASEMQTFTIGGTTFLAVAGQGDDGVSVFTLTGGSPYLTHADTLFDIEDRTDLDLDGARHLSVHQTGGKTYLTVASSIDYGLDLIEVGSDGTLTWRDGYAFNAYYSTGNSWPSDGFELNGQYYVLVSGSSQLSRASIMSIDPVTDQISGAVQDVGAPEVTGITGQSAVLVVGDIAYLFVTNPDANRLEVSTYTGGFYAPFLTSATSPTRLDHATTVEAYQFGDQIVVAVGSYGDSGIQLFNFDPDFGTLTPTQWLAPTSDMQVETPLIGEAFLLGGTPHVLTASDGDDTLTLFAIGSGDDVLTGTFLPDLIEGFAGDDILLGLDGDDDILPGDGDDVVYAGSGDDYVFVSTGRDDMNGGDGHDTLEARDFNGWSMGVTIDFLRGQIILPDGTEQQITGFEEAHATEQDDVLIGDYTDDTLLGMGGNDLLRGREGNDTLEAGAGDDQAYGAAGDDVIELGAGADRSNGGEGADVMRGGSGDDLLFAGAGDDHVEGGSDNDLIRGNDGDDTLIGGSGDDDLQGQQGDDTLIGTSGNNTLRGGGGRDTLVAGTGSDDMTGGSAIDTFVFGTSSSTTIGENRVQDFQNGLDLIDLTAFGFASLGDVLAEGSQVGGDAVFDFGAGNTITLVGTVFADLDASDFLL